jgi:hypothetical protein
MGLQRNLMSHGRPGNSPPSSTAINVATASPQAKFFLVLLSGTSGGGDTLAVYSAEERFAGSCAGSGERAAT